MSDGTRPRAARSDLDPAELAAVLDEICDLFYVFDERGDCRYWNDAVCAVTGYDDAAIAEMHPTDLFQAEDRETVAAAIADVVTDGERVTVHARLAPKSGGEAPYEFSGVPLGEDDEGLRLVAGVGRDVSDRNERQRQLRQLTEEYETIFDHTQDAIYLMDVADEESRYTFSRMNSKMVAQTDLAPDEVEGETLEPVLGEQIADTVRESFDECVRRREPVSYEVTAQVPRPGTVWRAKVAPVVIDDEVVQLVGSARNVTVQRERERELRRQNERLQEFANVVSHDLRNPLNVAQSRLELATDEYDSDDLAAVASSLDRMTAIVTDVLTLTREGETVTDDEWVDVGVTAHEAWSMVETAEASLETPARIRVRADPDSLQRLFENLLRNAVEHGGQTVTVTVDSLATGFVVSDDGPGIPAADRESVFEPGQTTSREGTGFELAIVRRIAEAHGWEVSIAESPAGGARFEFTGVATP